MPLRLLYFICCCGCYCYVAAQAGNPFDLGSQPSAHEAAASRPSVIPGNPFELRDTAAVPARTAAAVGPVPTTSAPTDDRRAVFGWFIGISLLLTLAVVLLRGELRKCYAAFLNENLLNALHRDQTGLASPPLQLLHLVFLVTGGFYLFLLLRTFGLLPFSTVAANFLTCLTALAGAVALKHTTLLLLATVFPLRKALGRYSFTVLTFSIILGFGLYPFCALLAFGPNHLHPYVVWASIIGIGLLYLFRSIRALFGAGSLPTQRAFHFLLYLCSIEIAPILLLWKALS